MKKGLKRAVQAQGDGQTFKLSTDALMKKGLKQ